MRKSAILRRRINSLARRLGWSRAPARPIRAWISPTTRCNLRCLTCGKTNLPVHQPQDMSEETYAIVRREILPYLNDVILTGEGEPFMAALLPRMLEDCERHGIHVSLTTNATFPDEELIRRLVRMRGQLVVSIDGADEATLKHVRRGASFARVNQTLELIARAKRAAAVPGFEFIFNVVLLRMNLDQLDAIVDWGRRLGIDCFQFSNFCAAACQSEFAGQSLERHPEIVNPRLDEIAAKCEALGIGCLRPQFRSGGEGETKRQAGRLLQCALPWWGIYIEANGAVFPCCQWWPPLGNLHDRPYAKIWNGPEFREVRRGVNALPLPEPCQRCILNERRY